jgi:hypothetical protein
MEILNSKYYIKKWCVMKFVLVFITALIFVKGSALYSNEETLSYYYEIARENCHDISAIRKEMDRIIVL